MPLHIQFLGSGDAFGSGGRLQSCILLDASPVVILIDCGASAMIGMRRYSINPNDVGMILISHLHGDHFGGLPFFILDAQLVSKRTTPLTIIGPPGMKGTFIEAMESAFPGSSGVQQKFTLDIAEFASGKACHFKGIKITPYATLHGAAVSSYALRMDCGGKTVAYSSDTEWTESLVPVAENADLFIAEAYYYEKKVKYHMDYLTLRAYRDHLKVKRLVVTHMSRDMLSMLDKIDCEYAEDGKIIPL